MLSLGTFSYRGIRTLRIRSQYGIIFRMTQHEQSIAAEMNRCLYFTGIHRHECQAGINYHQLFGDGFGCFKHICCLNDPQSPVSCAQRLLPTREKAEVAVAEVDAIIARTLTAAALAKKDAAGKGLKRGNGGLGEIPCPNCAGTVKYAISAVNGHMHAACSTKDCVAYME